MEKFYVLDCDRHSQFYIISKIENDMVPGILEPSKFLLPNILKINHRNTFLNSKFNI